MMTFLDGDLHVFVSVKFVFRQASETRPSALHGHKILPTNTAQYNGSWDVMGVHNRPVLINVVLTNSVPSKCYGGLKKSASPVVSTCLSNVS